jgi:hypothetical protein
MKENIMNHDKPNTSEGLGLDSQLSDRMHNDAADLSAFGMGAMEGFNRHLVLPLQRDFPPPLHRNDDSGDVLTEAGELVLHHTLHGKLLFLFLVLAMALRPAADKWNLLADTLRGLYR